MTFFQWWEIYWQYFAVGVGTAVYTFIVVVITAKRKDYVWHHTIGQHLGEITKSEIGKMEAQVAKQSFELDTAQKHLKAMRDKVQTMAALASKQIELAGNTFREDEK